MRKHGWKVGDVVTLRGDSNRLDIKFTMVGEIPADNYPNFFMFRRDYLVEAEKAIGIPEEKHPAGFLVTRVDTAAICRRSFMKSTAPFTTRTSRPRR